MSERRPENVSDIARFLPKQQGEVFGASEPRPDPLLVDIVNMCSTEVSWAVSRHRSKERVLDIDTWKVVDHAQRHSEGSAVTAFNALHHAVMVLRGIRPAVENK